jgi:hypothetical protein
VARPRRRPRRRPPPRGAKTRRPVEIEAALEALTEHEVEFIVIGGWAVIGHGSQRLTRDLDIVPNPSVANGRRLIAALVELGAEYRVSSGRWVKLKPKADPKWLRGANHLFNTTVGGIDLFYKMKGVPTWKEARPSALEAEAFGSTILILDKDLLIKSKLAAGRDQDLSDVAELNQAG